MAVHIYTKRSCITKLKKLILIGLNTKQVLIQSEGRVQCFTFETVTMVGVKTCTAAQQHTAKKP